MRLMLIADRANTTYAQLLRAVTPHEIVAPKLSGVAVLRTHSLSAKRLNADGIICACKATLMKLVAADGQLVDNPSDTVTLRNYRGSVYEIEGIPVIVMDSLKSIFAFPHGKLIAERYINKITHDWPIPREPEFMYTDFDKDPQGLLARANEALMIAIDIETVKFPVDPEELDTLCRSHGTTSDGLWAAMKVGKSSKKPTPCIPTIDMVGYSLLLKGADGKLYSESFTIPFDGLENLNAIRKLNNTKAPKVMQNGGYDSTYFIRFGCPVYNWIYDTFHFMHSWYAEMPRDLGFIGSMFLSKHRYWKNEIGSNRLEYCAKDVHGTLWAMVFMVQEAPTWVLKNYTTVFKKCFPNITAGLEGDKMDFDEQQNLLTHYRGVVELAQKRLETLIGGEFNPNSSPQTKKLMGALSSIKYTSTAKTNMRRWREEHPLNQMIGEAIKDVREAQKKISTYILATHFDGRLLYEINASGTDTGRASSKASNLWTGTQRQNIDGKVKSMFVADEGWEYGACDGSQAESRTTAYISEDPNLINAVENAPDFHTRNASMFFGIEETQISKTLRTLGKRVNHGANYNMGAGVLIDTMGMKMVLEAKYLLGLSNLMSLGGVASHLLGCFDTTYPLLRTKYYDEVIQEVGRTNMLKLPCEEIHWIRYCHGNPSRTKKRDLNLYVAHMPQSLSAQIVDKAWFDFWYKWQIQENLVRVKAQVHDEVQHQSRIGEPRRDEIDADLQRLMSRPYTVRGRTLRIPADVVLHGHRLSDVKD